MPSYRRTRAIGVGGALAIVALVAAGLGLSLAGHASAAEEDRTIVAGSGEQGFAVNLFGPGDVTVVTGATVTFANPWFEPHTITFPGPETVPPPSDPNAAVPTNPGEVIAYDNSTFLSSGFIFKDESFEVSFPTNGEYPFFCIIHPGMAGTVTVVDGGETVSAQADLDQQAADIFAADLVNLKAAAVQAAAVEVVQEQNTDGTTTWRVNTAGVLVGTSDVMQFFPPSMPIGVGDTVVWQSGDPTPHTVTFFGSGPPPDDFAPPVPVAELAPSYDGAGFVNSGFIGTFFPAGETFSVTFTNAGTFPYVCILHADQGMVGTVTVAEAEAAQVTAPESGNAGLADSGGGAGPGGWLWLLLFGVTAATFVGGRALVGRKGEISRR